MSSVALVFAGIVCVLAWRWFNDPLGHIPTVGPSLPPISYLGAVRFLTEAKDMVQEGYAKYPVFKVALPDRWLVIVSGVKMNEGLQRIPDEQASFDAAGEELLHPKVTVAREAYEHHIHIAALKEWMPRNLPKVFPAILDEIQRAFDELIPASDEWTPVEMYPIISQVVVRASNRLFVGAPLCRDPKYLSIMRNHTDSVNRAIAILTLFPRFLKPIVARICSGQKHATRALRPFVKPLIYEREQLLDDPSADESNDVLMWCLREARRIGHRDHETLLVHGLLAINTVAIHTSTATFTHALYHLAASPEWIEPLREEVERATSEYGWTKASLARMLLLDSFLKESQRLNGVGCVSLMRYTLQDITLPNGVSIPAGSLVAGAATSTHHDETLFPDASSFDPLRFANMISDGQRIRRYYVSTSSTDIGFGHGKHACPGRFFAANELKTMLAYVVTKYDVKFEDEGKRPGNEWVAFACYPARHARVLFKKRSTV